MKWGRETSPVCERAFIALPIIHFIGGMVMQYGHFDEKTKSI